MNTEPEKIKDERVLVWIDSPTFELALKIYEILDSINPDVNEFWNVKESENRYMTFGLVTQDLVDSVPILNLFQE